jgi:hypothetical protein
MRADNECRMLDAGYWMLDTGILITKELNNRLVTLID